MSRLQTLLPLLFLCVGTFEARSHHQQYYNDQLPPQQLPHHHHHHHHHHQHQHHANKVHEQQIRTDQYGSEKPSEEVAANNGTSRSLRLTLIDAKPGGGEFDDFYHNRSTNRVHRQHRPAQFSPNTEVFRASALPPGINYHR